MKNGGLPCNRGLQCKVLPFNFITFFYLYAFLGPIVSMLRSSKDFLLIQYLMFLMQLF